MEEPKGLAFYAICNIVFFMGTSDALGYSYICKSDIQLICS